MPELTIAVYGDYVVDRVHRLIQPYRRHTANTVATNVPRRGRNPCGELPSSLWRDCPRAWTRR